MHPHLEPKQNVQTKLDLAKLLLPYSFMLLVCMMLGFAFPTPGSEVAVVTSPFTKKNSAHLVIATNGQLVNVSNWSFISVAKSEDPKFISRLYAGGALFVFNAHLVSDCLQQQS